MCAVISRQFTSPAAACVLQRDEVLGHVTETVEVAADAAEVTERGQQSVQPQAPAEVSVFDIRLAQLGVSLTVRRQADILAQPARLLDEVHVRHDLGRHLAKPLSVDGCDRHRHKEDEDLKGFSVIQHVGGVVHSVDGEINEGTS